MAEQPPQEASTPPPEVKPAGELLQELESQFDAPPQSSIHPRQSTAEETEYLDNAYRQAVVDKINQDNVGRIKYAELIFTITVVWLLLILMIVFQCGKGILKLSDTVIVTLITTTTASVFGFFLLVVNYYFNKDKST